MANVLEYKKIRQEASSTSLDKTDIKFALKLYKDNNSIASTTQIYLSLHNVTCFKYKIAVTGKY